MIPLAPNFRHCDDNPTIVARGSCRQGDENKADTETVGRRVKTVPDGQDGDMGFHVDSEAGRLRRVILHRPDLELKRLTPSNKDTPLFDDVLWVRRARAEHDGFADVLRDRGVAVHLFGDLLTEALEIP